MPSQLTASANSNVAHHLERVAASHADRAALHFPLRFKERETFSFRELNTAVDATAQLLTEIGIRQGTRTLLMVRPGGELIVSVFALFKLGAVPVVIDPGMGLGKFLTCVQRTQPEALVGIPLALWLARLFRGTFRNVRTKVSVASSRYSSALLATSATLKCPCVQSQPTDPAAILFTSGSTGPAKGVCYEHGMFDAQVQMIKAHYAIQPGEVDLPLLPVFALFNPALGMASVVPQINPSRPASLNPAPVVEAIRHYQVTNSFGSPALWTRIGRYCKSHAITLPSMRRILMAGAPVPPALVQLFKPLLPNGEIHTPYGATEALPLCSIQGSAILKHASKQASGAGTCVGKAFPDVEIKIIQDTSSPIDCLTPEMECETGVIGEIIARASVVTRTYDALPEATARAKILREATSCSASEHPTLWHRMGDLGYLDKQGRLWFVGRQAETVRTAEQTFYTDCCEAVFNPHPLVFRSALIGLSTPEGQIPAIVIEPEAGQFPKSTKDKALFIKSLKKLAKKHAHTRPIQHFFFAKKFPVDVRHNAKIHRLTLAKQFRL